MRRDLRLALGERPVAAATLTALVILYACATACVDPRCYQDADCTAPAICTSQGRCAVECERDTDCSALLTCVRGRCQPRATRAVTCPADMVPIAGAFCMDRHEASRQDATAQDDGEDDTVAVSLPGVLPWQVRDNATAAAACAAAGKRLCAADEWRLACRGIHDTDYPYGDRYQSTTCNGIDAFGRSAFHLMPTGSFAGCDNGWGALDLSGNLWEHVAGGDDTRVRGGAYNCSDSAMLHRCDYIPGNWTPSARGFRCCADGSTARDAGPVDHALDVSGGDAGGCATLDGATGDRPAADRATADQSPADGRSADASTRDRSPDEAGVDDAGASLDTGGADRVTGDAGGAREDAAGCDATEDGGCPCPDDMVAWGAICVDRHEASRADATATGQGSASGRAYSRPGVVPWYTSSMNAVVHQAFEAACQAAGKRLCRSDEWLDLCTGGGATIYATGDLFEPSRCNSVETHCQECCDILGNLAECPTGSNCGYSSQLTSSYTPETCGLDQPYSLESCHVCYRVMPTAAFARCGSAAGALDVNGNVWEVVTAPGGGYEVRGGAFNCGSPAARFRCDFNATWSALYAGFRCCQDRR